jgi:hypothetical protein
VWQPDVCAFRLPFGAPPLDFTRRRGKPLPLLEIPPEVVLQL